MTVRTLVALVLALLAPSAATAATSVDDLQADAGLTLLVDGDAGDNRITISLEGEFVYVTEEGSTVTEDADRCEPADARVRCEKELLRVVVRGLGGDDTLVAEVPATPFSLIGGAGGDRLDGSPETEFSGGDGDDTLNARAGAFSAGDSGGPGNDTFNGNPAEPDHFAQEPGGDTYAGGSRTFTALDCLEGCMDGDSIAYATGPVTVTLDGLPGDGAAGEGDNVHGDVDVVAGSDAGDTLDVAGAPGPHSVDGRGGDDAITGGAAGDLLAGGTGADTISGLGGDDRLDSGGGERDAPSPDRLDGGDGDDMLVPGHGAEELIGAAGIDQASFSRVDGDAPTGFEITLDDQPNDGARGAGEGDNVHADVEVISTGAGNDRIVGAGGAEQLLAGAGDDELEGRGGVDNLGGGPGADTLLARDGGFDLVNCGEGADPTAVADEGDRVENCEAAALAPLPAPPDRARPQVALAGRTSMSAKAFARARGVTVTARTDEPVALLAQTTVRGMIARAGDYVLGERSLPLARAGSRKLRMRFSRRDVRAIRRKLRRRAYRMTVRVTATDAAGNRATAMRRVTIRRGR